MFCKQKHQQQRLCNCKEKTLQDLEQTQEELSKHKTKLLEQEEVKRDIVNQQAICKSIAAELEALDKNCDAVVEHQKKTRTRVD